MTKGDVLAACRSGAPCAPRMQHMQASVQGLRTPWLHSNCLFSLNVQGLPHIHAAAVLRLSVSWQRSSCRSILAGSDHLPGCVAAVVTSIFSAHTAAASPASQMLPAV